MRRFDERAGQLVPSYWHSDTENDVLDERAKWHAEPRPVVEASSDVARERDAYERWQAGECCGLRDDDGQCLAQIVQRDRLEILRRASPNAAVHRYCYRCEWSEGYECVLSLIGNRNQRQAEAGRVWGLRFVSDIEGAERGDWIGDNGQSEAGARIDDEDAGRERDSAGTSACVPRID